MRSIIPGRDWGGKKSSATRIAPQAPASSSARVSRVGWIRSPRFLGALSAATLLLMSDAPWASGQGCIPAHYMSLSLSLGAEGVPYLAGGQWQVGLGYRYLDSETVFVGSHEEPQLYNVGGRNSVNSIDVNITYGLSSRFALALTVPFEHDDFSLIQGDGQRHSGSTGGLGDVRLVATGWLLAPEKHPHGNISLGVGPKFPTGDYSATDLWHTAGGEVLYRPVDIAAQLGDGGFGIVLQLQAFQRIVTTLYGYAEGSYLINPRVTNGTERPPPGSQIVNSVPDQYFGRAGLAWVFWPSQGLSLTLGARIDGIPVGDLIGGTDDGFRRAGYSIYVDPGVNWVFGRNALSLNGPVAVDRAFQATSTSNAGALADYLIVFSYSRQF